MVFSSPLFLFVFLPVVLGGYFLVPARLKNLFLLGASLAFYLVGAGGYIWLLLFSVVTNYLFGRGLEGASAPRRRLLLAGALITNLLPLVVYKYATFGAASANTLLTWLHADAQLPLPEFFLPAGISFFAFQGLAYVVDVYRRDIRASRSLVQFALFKTFFPQLVAGPIVRYRDLAQDLAFRNHSVATVVSGLERFGFGLAKKVLLADSLGRVADAIYNGPTSEWSAGNAWLALLCYTFQIFFDFSGYSDMAIGMGRICGLSLPENFRQPYLATSITEFWRRWHITLSSWFRDYVYLPLGGNRVGAFRLSLHLVIVFVLCGLWHGANTTFVVWGLFHGGLLVAERLLRRWWGFTPQGIGGWAYTFGATMIGWILFRCPSLAQAKIFFQALTGGGSVEPVFPAHYYLTPNVLFFLGAAALTAFWPSVTANSAAVPARPPLWPAARPWAALLLCLLAVVAQAPQSFNPFIYFQF